MTLFSIALLLLMGSLAFGELSESRKEQLTKVLLNDKHLNVQKFTQEERAWIEDWIFNVGLKEPGVDEENYHRQLLQLGHRPTIAKYGELIAGGGRSHYVFGANQPRLIQFYEPQLSIDEPAWAAQVSDSTSWRTSILAAGQILRNLSGSQEVPPDVRRWAGELSGEISILGSDDPKARKGLEEGRGIVREWWTENKQAVVEERFADIKPGKVHSFILEKQPKPASIEPAESVVKRPEPRSESSSAPKATQEVAEAPKESGNWYWVVPAVCVALLVGLVAAFRKKR